MNRYNGNTGRFEKVPDTGSVINQSPPVYIEGENVAIKKPSSQSGVFGGLGGILSKFGKLNLEMEDLILVGVLYLLYRESGDVEFLLIAGAMLFL